MPAFKHTERSGRPFARRDLMGGVWVGEFIFTRCAGSCPVMISRMMTLYKKAPEAAYVSFTVDPDYDTLPLEHFEPMVHELFAHGQLVAS